MTGNNILLTGLMGAGKTSVGKALAGKLGYGALDLDFEIERAARKKISDIFAEAGEEAFRDLETQTLRALGGLQRMVIATGGGTPLRAENRILMRELGQIVWLDITPETAYARTQAGDRPLLQNGDALETLTRLATERLPAYRDCDLRVDGNGTTEAVAEKIFAALGH